LAGHEVPDLALCNVLADGQRWGENGRHDRLYLPRVVWTNGDVDSHDIALDRDGRVIIVSSLFNCLATVSESHSFAPLWKPDFISQIAPGDRCRLNGVATADGILRFVTAAAKSDTKDGNLYVRNSFAGEFGRVNREHGTFDPIAVCPGFLRGLAFCGPHSVVGLSKPRDKAFTGLPLDAALKRRGKTADCGLAIIDIETGSTKHWLKFDPIISELYDVVVLPDIRSPAVLGFNTDDVHRVLTMAPAEPL